MKKLLITTAVTMLTATATFADAPAGADATPCDPAAFTAVVSTRTGEILYWNNPTCKTVESGLAIRDLKPEPEPEDE